MDAVERVSAAEADGSARNARRYELAAEVCAGLRVVDLGAGGDGAEILSRSATAVTPVESAAVQDWLDGPLPTEVDAIVLLSGLEKLPDPERAIERLAAHGEAGATVIVSLADDGAAPALLKRLADARVLRLGADPGADRRALDLERENRALRRANQRLARERLATADAAAAAAIRRSRDGAELPVGLEAVAAVGARAARGLATVVLNILPHALTLVLLRIRARLRQDQST